MKIYLKLDVRERALNEQCVSLIHRLPKFSDIVLSSEPLTLGDAVINDGTEDRIIIERKTLPDLAASLKDGRYTEQSHRLNGIDHPNHNVIFLFEGDATKHAGGFVEQQTMYSAMFSVNYFKGFSIMRTMTTIETAMVICNMAYKLGVEKGRRGYYDATPIALLPTPQVSVNPPVVTKTKTKEEEEEEEEVTINQSTDDNTNHTSDAAEDAVAAAKRYCAVVKRVKKDNVTRDNIGELMLCQIPGVSTNTALSIIEQFKTVAELTVAIRADSNCLNDMRDIKSGRKISRRILGSIVEFLA